MVDRLELALLDAKQALIRGLRAAIAAAFAVAALFCGWLCVNATVAASLRERLSMASILGILAAINAGIGIIAGVTSRWLAAPQNQNGGRNLP